MSRIAVASCCQVSPSASLPRAHPQPPPRAMSMRARQRSRLAALVSLGFLAGVPLSQAGASDVDAAAYYKTRCSTCHGADGEGTRDKSPSLGPALRDNPLVINAPLEVLVRIIRQGRGGQQRAYDDAFPNMPAFDAGMVPDPAGLAEYLKTALQAPTPAPKK